MTETQRPDDKSSAGATDAVVASRRPALSVRHVPAPLLDGLERLRLLVPLLCAEDPEEIAFHAGDTLVKEGASLVNQSALLVIDGELEESIATWAFDAGPSSLAVHTALTGDVVNLQALVAPYNRTAAQCSVYAITDGFCYPVWRDDAERIPELAALLAFAYPRWAEAIEAQRAMIMALEDANVQQLHGQLTDKQRQLDEVLRDLRKAREAAEEFERKLGFEQRARAALERRALELTQQIAVQSEAQPPMSERFPAAVRLLGSSELEELEGEASRYRELAGSLENRARMLHRAMELLARDNPGIRISPEIMQLMLGEDPGGTQAAPPGATRSKPLSRPAEAHATMRSPPPKPSGDDN